MKGRLFSYEEVQELKNGDKVWVEDSEEYMQSDIHILRAGKLYDDVGSFWDLDSSTIRVYEWIEEDKQTITKESTLKTYKGSEILAMIENGKLQIDDVIVNKEGYKTDIFAIIEGVLPSDFLLKNIFTIKQKPVDFMTAVNSGKNIRPETLKEKGFKPYTYWFGNIVSNMDSNKGRTPMNPLDLINGQWEIEY